MNTTLFSSPQILTGTLALTTGNTQTVSLEANASRSHRWLCIHELSISLSVTGYTAEHQPVPGRMLGSFVNFRAYAYNQMLTRDYTPIWLMGPRLHAAAEFSPASATGAGIDGYSGFETYRWKFAKPFFLPPGSAFKVQLQRNGGTQDIFAGGTVNATVVARCVQLSEQEAKAIMNGNNNPLPFLAAFVPPWVASFLAPNLPFKSNNLDLANPFLVPWQIQRMTARVSPSNSNSGPDYGSQASAGSQIRLTDTRTVICEWSNLMAIFPAPQMAWTHTRVLQPAEYITAELKVTDPDYYQPQVAVIGYRNEVLS